jgi:hypothetical protein
MSNEATQAPADAKDATRLARFRAALLEPRTVGWVMVGVAVAAALQQYLLGPKMMGSTPATHYNNYRIFEQSFWHLLRGADLYGPHPLEHADLFKYSPTFAALMAPFAVLPDVVGLVLWNALNGVVLALALAHLPLLDPRQKALAGWFVLREFLTSAQGTQANILVTGLIVLVLVALEADRPGWAALAVATAFYVKVYPAAAALLFLLYPRKARFLAWSAVWVLVLGALPLLLVSLDRLVECYAGWWRLLMADQTAKDGLSVMRTLRAWLHLDPPKAAVAIAGAAILAAPLVRLRAHRDPTFRLLFLASILIWVIIFNHMAESATFVLAVTGVAIWYFARPRGRGALVLLALVLVFTSFSPSFPDSFVVEVAGPNAWKAIPCILVWLVLTWELATGSFPPVPGGARDPAVATAG